MQRRQLDFYSSTNLDKVSRSGIATGLISIPNRYMHTPVEIVSWKDMNAAADLLARYCESITPDESYIPE